MGFLGESVRAAVPEKKAQEVLGEAALFVRSGRVEAGAGRSLPRPRRRATASGPPSWSPGWPPGRCY
eukprot:4995075-Alexandrium_andersonii.AAC.1